MSYPEKPSSRDIARLMIAVLLLVVAAGGFMHLLTRFGANPFAKQGTVTMAQLLGLEEARKATRTPGDIAGAADRRRTSFEVEAMHTKGLKKSAKSVEFVRSGNVGYLRYQGMVYAPQVGFELSPANLPDADYFPWKPIFDAPADVGGLNEVYSFMTTADTTSAVIVMRWGSNSVGDGTRYAVYVYNELDAQNPVRMVHTFVEENLGDESTIPKASGISPDGRYITLGLFPCSDCTGRIPDTMVIDTKKGLVKNVGPISLIEWMGNGQFQYKEYREVECPDKTVSAKCAIDPKFLPFRSGSL